jgi:hypothetical protein
MRILLILGLGYCAAVSRCPSTPGPVPAGGACRCGRGGLCEPGSWCDGNNTCTAPCPSASVTTTECFCAGSGGFHKKTLCDPGELCGDGMVGGGVGCYPQCAAGPVTEEPVWACACGANATKLCGFEEPSGWCVLDASGTNGTCVDECSDDPPGMAKSGYVAKTCGCHAGGWRMPPPEAGHLELCTAGRWCQEPSERQRDGDGECVSACASSGIVASECPCGAAATSLCTAGSWCDIATSTCTNKTEEGARTTISGGQ